MADADLVLSSSRNDLEIRQSMNKELIEKFCQMREGWLPEVGVVYTITLTGREREEVLQALEVSRPEEAKATEILRELVAAGDYTVSGEDDVAAMLRFGKANDAAKAFLSRVPQERDGK